jgi:hypothetical protein
MIQGAGLTPAGEKGAEQFADRCKELASWTIRG